MKAPEHPHRLRTGFAGTPDFAASILRTLLDSPVQMAVAYTQPDRRAGRGQRQTGSPVKALAREHGLPIEQPHTLKDPSAVAQLRDYQLDVLVVAAYGLLLPPEVLSLPRLGCVNVHASLLPRWRGAAPVERAIMAGDPVTGVSIMQMDAGLDTGPVFATQECPIGPHTEGPELEAQLAEYGAQLLVECMANLEQRSPVPQAGEGATYARKLTATDAQLSWDQPADQVHRQIRALCSRLPATVTIGDLRIRLLKATPSGTAVGAPPGTILGASRKGIVVACNPGQLTLTSLQLNRGKGRPMGAAAALNGYADVFATGRSLASTS